MNLEDLKDRFTSEGRQLWERLQESTLFNQLRDRYENMSPAMQKVSILGICIVLSLFVLSFPYSNFADSQGFVSEFESKRATIRELQKVTREASDVPQIPQAPSVESLRSTIDSQIKSARLIPEQIKSTEVVENNSQIIPKNLAEGMIKITLEKLNLMQILDLGYQFQSISPSVKMTDLAISANRTDARYFDVIYKLVTLAVPPPPEVAAAPEPKSLKKNQPKDDE